MNGVKLPPQIKYQDLANGPMRAFEKYLLVSPSNVSLLREDDVLTDVPNLVACLVVNFRDRHDEDIKRGESFIFKPQHWQAKDVQVMCDQLWQCQQDWTEMCHILMSASARLLLECLKEVLRRLEEPPLMLSEDTEKLLRNPYYERVLIHRSAKLQELIEDTLEFVGPNSNENSGVKLNKKLHQLYAEDEDGEDGGKIRKAKRDLRNSLQQDLRDLEPIRAALTRFLMSNVNQLFNYFIYKTVWRLRMKRGMSHKEAKGVIEPEVEVLALNRISRELGPLLIGFTSTKQGGFDKNSLSTLERFKIKVLKDFLVFVSPRCWYNFEKKNTFERHAKCHSGCPCGFGDRQK